MVNKNHQKISETSPSITEITVNKSRLNTPEYEDSILIFKNIYKSIRKRHGRHLKEYY